MDKPQGNAQGRPQGIKLPVAVKWSRIATALLYQTEAGGIIWRKAERPITGNTYFVTTINKQEVGIERLTLREETVRLMLLSSDTEGMILDAYDAPFGSVDERALTLNRLYTTVHRVALDVDKAIDELLAYLTE